MTNLFRQAAAHRTVKRIAAMMVAMLLLSFVAIPEVEAACPNASFPALGNVVELVSCTEAKASGNVSNINVPVPAAVNNGDVLVTVLARDDDLSAFTAPGGWALAVDQVMDDNDGRLSVFSRVSNGSEPANYNFSWSGTEEIYAFMMRFTGASGQGVAGQNSGNGGTAQAPSVNTLVANSLILRIVGWDDDDETDDPGTIVAGHTNITQDASGTGGGTSSGGAAYLVQSAIGATGTANFANGNEQWAAATVAVDPIEFRISLPEDGELSVCSIDDTDEAVTISVTDRDGTAMTWFTGTITLSASNATGASWADAGALNGTLTDLGNGNATYTFAAGDNGVATFDFVNENVGTTNFDIEYNGISSVESSGFDPNLAITDCAPVINTQACLLATSNTITIPARDAVATKRGRMVLLAVSLEGTSDVSAATFDVGGSNAAMTQIYESINSDGAGNITELWGILDADLPAAAGTYTGSFVTGDDSPSMCLLFIDDVTQSFPLPDGGTPANGAVNGSQAQGQQNAVTSITTPTESSLVLSLVGNGSGGTDYSAVAPSPPMTRLFDAPDPGGGAEFEGSSGIVPAAGSFTVTETWGGGSPNRHSHLVASFAPLPIVPTEIRLSHDGESDVCSLEAITITLTDSDGFIAKDFTGTITITNSANAGTWTVNDATNSLTNNGSGSVSYTFADADDGQIVLNYQLTSTNASVNFNVTSTTPGIDPPSGADDPTLEVVGCTTQINVNSAMNVCDISETVTLSVRNRDGGLANGTIGTIVLNTSTAKGNWLSTTGAGTLNNGVAGNGQATYLFNASDGGTVNFEFKAVNPQTLNITASKAGISFDSGSSSNSLQILACQFRIAHSGTSDVCSVEVVTISVFNSSGAAVTDYAGTINLSTTTGNGTWALSNGNGTVTDAFAEDGNATYAFSASDDGTVELEFRDATAETVNINVSDGVSTASNASFDPNLAVANCSFRITLGETSMSACASETVTITVYDSSSAIATNYQGTVSLVTSTLNGTWADAGGLNGTLTDTTSGDGAATYTFDSADNGTATFDFTSTTPETINFNLTAGSITENGSFDPNLEVTGCLPSVANSVCFPGSGPGAGNMTINGSDQGRMVVMLIWHIDGTPQTVTSATFNGVGMEQISSVANGNTAIEMWGIKNADLPGTGGSYAGAYSFNAAPANDPSMCMVELANVEQEFPEPNLSTPPAGAVNTSTGTDDGAPLDLTTSITTTGNNALILTAALSDYSPGGNSWFNAVEPTPPMEQYFFNNNNQNPENGTAGGSIGVKAAAGLITVTDTDTQDADSNAAHIVASFNPIVAGDPQAEGYVPVLLYETFSGNIAYKAIGSTLRSASNDSGGECSFVPTGTGTTATLSMPASSTVLSAYLYWAGSGSEAQADDTVEFGPTGSIISITADDIFLIENTGGSNNADYFAGYKEVTAQITGNGDYTFRNLTVQTGFPYNGGAEACAGGWGLVVLYSNPNERFRVANLFHGFQPFQNSSFALVPRNFRMATTDNPSNTPGAGFLPNGEITHITVEGDETLSGGDDQVEALAIQTAPGADTFNILTNSFNPEDGDFNSTVSRPIFSNTFGTGFFEFDASAGLNSDGYEIDQPGDDAVEAGRTGDEIGESWGFDIDTHYIAGNDSSGKLWNFAQPGAEAEAITTRYSSGQDLVLLLAEVITVTNFDLADLELFINESGDFNVGGTGSYLYTVTNNGNGGVTGGEATGQILVANTLPAGMTLSSVSGSGWDCSVTSANGFTCAFDIANDCGVTEGCSTTGELDTAESLPVITANVIVGGVGSFPDLSNNVKNTAVMQHNGGSCPALVAGVVPDPDDCDREPQFDNVNDLQGGAIDINDLVDKSTENNNVVSIITEVRGVETNLRITKVANGVLEEGESGSYTLTVTNLGPDSTTGGVNGTITVTDPQPTGVTFTSAVGTEPDWTCSVGPFNCTYDEPLASGSSLTITLNVDVTGSQGDNVTNTAQVAAGTYNFDPVSGNNQSTVVTGILAPLVSSNERFLLSVSHPVESTEIGGLSPFENDDYIVYDPSGDTGEMFYDNSDEGYSVDDANAVHLFKNGHIAVSAENSSTIGSNTLAFEPEDIVIWDPILKTATMLFDGSTLFDGPIGTDENIDAVYVKDDGRILFSTHGPASATFAGPTTVSWNQGDIVEYDPSDGSFTILVDASDPEIFGGEVQVDAIYLRVDDSDPDDTKEVYVLSVNETSATVGACVGCDPEVGTTLSRDDVVELDLTGANPVTQGLFVGNVELGVFEPESDDREIDALHVVEDGYVGHFAIVQSQAGNTCEAGQITIRKHKGLSHSVDTDYAGSVLITTDIDEGDWSIAVGNGTLNNGTADDGAATYTFVASDNGEVTLFLTEESESVINVDVTNTFVGELQTPGEDPNFSFSDLVTAVTFRDEWSAASYANNDGSTIFAGNWQETDGGGAGPTAGNIQGDTGKLEMTATPGDTTPSIYREFDLSTFEVDEDIFLNFDYSYEFLNSGSDVLIVEVSPNGGSSWNTVRTFSGIGGTNLTPQGITENITSDLGVTLGTEGPDDARVRFRITGGYTGTSKMFFDNIEIATGTTGCNIGSIDHYEIKIDGQTAAISDPALSGIQCIASLITITAHDAGDLASAPEETVNLEVSTDKGDWTLMSGTGTLNNGTLGDGDATYTFGPGEVSATFYFNYTDPTSDPEVVNFRVFGNTTLATEIASEDPNLSVAQSGLLFTTRDDGVWGNGIPRQISGKASNVAAPSIDLITIEGVRTSDFDSQACSPLFDAGNTLSIEFAAECLDPSTCAGEDLSVTSDLATVDLTPATDNAGAGTVASYTALNVPMENNGSGHVGGELVLMYPDAGEIQLHARYDIPLANVVGGVDSTDNMVAANGAFVVRPFGFSVDFSSDRLNNTDASYAADSDGTRFQIAGSGFDTTVRAVQYDADDDDNSDGIPDETAELWDNTVTPNFGNESTPYKVQIDATLTAPANSTGNLTNTIFDNFVSGAQSHSMTFDEVGIIDLDAFLIDASDDPVNYLNTDPLDSYETVIGLINDVGRFYPASFELTSPSITSRVLARANGLCLADPMMASGTDRFTYLGEEFAIGFQLRAKNASGVVTLNYTDGFAKLGTEANDTNASAFEAFEIVAGPDTVIPGGISIGNTPVTISWPANNEGGRGVATVGGNLILNKNSQTVGEGPYEDITIGYFAVDSDTVPVEVSIDIDEVMPLADDYEPIATENFRYGRLLIENAFGPETEDLPIFFSLEYFDGTSFVINAEDSCTVLEYNASEDDYSDRSLEFVSGTFTDALVEEDGDLVQDPGESIIELDNVVGDTDVSSSVYEGQIRLRSYDDIGETFDDPPFYAAAPDVTGGALIEFDLTNSGLPYPLGFLSFDWRDAAEDEDIGTDGVGDNPRAQVEFGTFRGHDRIINWQEIFIEPEE